MELEEARRKARRLMNRYGLQGWAFEFDRATKRAGACHHTKRKITLSRSITLLNDWEEVGDTVRHEIAHALVGHRARSHDRVWKAKAIEVGATPRRCYDSTKVKTLGPKWKALCDCDGKVFHYMRRPSRSTDPYCPDCFTNLVFVALR